MKKPVEPPEEWPPTIPGPLCPRGCNVPTHHQHRDHANHHCPPYHDCPRKPDKALEFLLVRIGSWTNARWDQHIRHEMGDQAADDLIRYLDEQGIRPSRGQ